MSGAKSCQPTDVSHQLSAYESGDLALRPSSHCSRSRESSPMADGGAVSDQLSVWEPSAAVR